MTCNVLLGRVSIPIEVRLFPVLAPILVTLYLCLHPAPQRLSRISRLSAGKLPLLAALPVLPVSVPWGLACSPLRGLGDRQTFTEVLFPKDIYDIIDFFVRQCIKEEMRFRVCKHCNKFFALTGHIGTEYCDRPFDSTCRTCKEIGALRLWEKKRDETPL